MIRSIALGMIALLAALAACIVVWPQALGLGGWYGPAQLVALRGLSTIAGLTVLLVLVVTAVFWKRARPYLLTVASVVAVATLLSVVIVLSRGLGGVTTSIRAGGTGDLSIGITAEPAHRPASGSELRVLSFNTLHDGVPAADLTALVKQSDADVVVLLEASRETTERVAEQSGGFGVFHHRIGSITSATGLLIAEDLGEYTGPDVNPGGRLASFTVWPTTPDAPPITAVHAYPPMNGVMRWWRADNAWAVSRCRHYGGAILAGDFNATVDHPGLNDPGPCVDAGMVTGAAATGTWPADWPSWAGTPIDHVVVDARRWTVTSFHVLDLDTQSDHRPILAILRS